MSTENKPNRPGATKPETLRLNEKWQDAVGQALKKERPAEGWPECPVKKRKRRKAK